MLALGLAVGVGLTLRLAVGLASIYICPIGPTGKRRRQSGWIYIKFEA